MSLFTKPQPIILNDSDSTDIQNILAAYQHWHKFKNKWQIFVNPNKGVQLLCVNYDMIFLQWKDYNLLTFWMSTPIQGPRGNNKYSPIRKGH